eukprot:g8066.t1
MLEARGRAGPGKVAVLHPGKSPVPGGPTALNMENSGPETKRRSSRRGSVPTESMGMMIEGKKNLIHEALMEADALAGAVGAKMIDSSQKAKHRPEKKNQTLQPVFQRTLGVKAVVIAGACGFMGRMMLFKILTHTPETCKVYALARGDAEQRVKQMLEHDPGLSLLPPEKKAKVIPVSWDMMPTDLKISPEMLRTLLAANIIINCAGLAEWNLPQDQVDAVNVDATVRLRKTFAKIGMFVQISSAFVNSFLGRTGSEIQEKQYYTFNTSADRFPNTLCMSKVTTLTNWENFPRLGNIFPDWEVFSQIGKYFPRTGNIFLDIDYS